MLHDNLYPYETDRGIEGKTIVTKGSNVNIRSGASTTAKVVKTVAASGTTVGKCSGRVWYDSNPQYKWYEIDATPPLLFSYIRNDLATLTGSATPIPASSATTKPKNEDEEAQILLDDILKQDTETMNNLNQATAMVEQLKAKGVSTTTSENKIKSIFKNIQERQEKLQKSTWAKVKDKVSNAWGSVKKFFGFSGHDGMGELITIAIIVVAAIAVGAGTTALVTLKPWKNQSNIDLKESKELKDLLDKADPVVAEKIRKDLKDQVVDAYKLGDRQATVSSYWNIGKYVLIAGLALWAAPKIMATVSGWQANPRKRNANA